jgi:Na+-transporting NADH:ubiquinone oxidoreductase subunit NqrB
MKILKLITWYPNMVQTMWNDMVQYTFNFHKNYKLFKLFLEYIYIFEYIAFVSTNILQSLIL